MKLFISSAYEKHRMLDAFRVIAEGDTRGEHVLCDSPEEADAILFVEDGQFDDYLYKGLRLNELVSRFGNKCFMYNEVDKPWCVLPGLYCNMPRRFFQAKRQIAFPLLSTPNEYVSQVYSPQDTSDRKWLYSFVGAASHRCRKSILALAEHTNAVQDTSDFNVWECSVEQRIVAERNYADVMSESYFSLCPRGIGTSSYRLFETMEAGRAPVIISDQWVEPSHVDWDFAIRIKESDVDSIPAYLQSIVGEARERGEAARAAWESAYAPEVLLSTVCDSIAQLIESGQQDQSTDYLEGARRLFIKHEVGALSIARRVRERLSDLTSPIENRS